MDGFFENLSSCQVTAPKRFWSFVNKQNGHGSEIPTLISKSGKNYSSDSDKCNEFSRFFSSVFTKERISPPIFSKQIDQLSPIIIHREGVLKLLKQIDVNKSAGYDRIPGRFLKESAEEVVDFVVFSISKKFRNGRDS